MEYRHGCHTKFKIEYHFVWATKYRYHMLQGELSKDKINEYFEHHFEKYPNDNIDIE